MPQEKIDDNDGSLEGLIKSLGVGRSILLASDVLDSWNLYEKFLGEIALRPSTIRVIGCTTASACEREISTLGDVKNLLVGEYYSETICIVLQDGLITIYNDPSSNLSASFVSPNLAQSYASEWDTAFCDHIQNSGVGFGNEGRAYISSLLANISAKLPHEAQRIGEISKCAIS